MPPSWLALCFWCADHMDCAHQRAILGLRTRYTSPLRPCAAGNDTTLVALRIFAAITAPPGRGDDFHVFLGAQFARHRPEDARANRLHRGLITTAIAVEADDRTVGAADSFFTATTTASSPRPS